jgi:dienelactone hydrolase
VHFEIVGDATTMTFDGRLAGDTLAGTFRDGDAAGEFVLVRQNASGPALSEAEVTFHNGDVALGGTLILPGMAGAHPAIIFVHGSGAEGRWASRFLATRFAESGFVALIFDKRGVGTSTGDWRTAGFEELASDVRAGIALLRRHPGVDSLRVGIHGHSQGATIAPLIAGSTPEVAFVIAAAAAGLPMDEVEIYSIENSVGMASLPAAETADASAYVRELVAVAYHGRMPHHLDSLTTRFRGRPWFFEPPGPDSHYWEFSRRIVGFDAEAHWAKVRVPVLLMYGERDARVPVQPSINRIITALLADGDGSLTVRVFPGADHSFRIRSDGGGFAWPRNAPGYLDDLISWARWAAQEGTGR